MPDGSFNLPPSIDALVPTTVSGIDALVADWVAIQLGMPIGCYDPCSGAGIVFNGDLIAGVVYNNYQRYEHGATIEASIASTDPRWATPKNLKNVFVYPFIDMKATRLQVTCRKSNKHARKFVVRLGFKMDGVARRLWEGRYDAVVYSMIPEECRWIDD